MKIYQFIFVFLTALSLCNGDDQMVEEVQDEKSSSAGNKIEKRHYGQSTHSTSPYPSSSTYSTGSTSSTPGTTGSVSTSSSTVGYSPDTSTFSTPPPSTKPPCPYTDPDCLPSGGRVIRKTNSIMMSMMMKSSNTEEIIAGPPQMPAY